LNQIDDLLDDRQADKATAMLVTTLTKHGRELRTCMDRSASRSNTCTPAETLDRVEILRKAALVKIDAD
jgi:excinuclease UvrABC helicase subunit UvrB